MTFEKCVKSKVKVYEVDSSDSSQEETAVVDKTTFREQVKDLYSETESDGNSSDHSDSESEDYSKPKLSLFGSTWTFLNQIKTPQTEIYLKENKIPSLKTSVNEQKRIEIFTNLMQIQLKYLKKSYKLEEFDLEIIKTFDLKKIASTAIVRIVCVLISLRQRENLNFEKSRFLNEIGFDEVQLELLVNELK